jgi:pimeloyl-[acyl-carrier protein] synthase
MISAAALPPQALLDQLRDDPYPLYERLRSSGPAVWLGPMRRWAVTSHELVLQVLKDERFSADRTRWEGAHHPTAPVPRTMLVSDPPDHTRLRTLVQKAFTPRVVERLRPRIGQRVHAVLDEAAARGGMDLIEDLAYLLPVMVIAELLGVPPEDHELFKAGSAAIAAALDPISPEERPVRDPARDQLQQYLAGIIAERRAEPRDDLVTRLVEAEEEGDRLDPDELLQMCILLLVAGHETTVNLIGNGVHTLLDHPDALARLRGEPELIEPAVEELLRFDGPVQLTGRVATQPVELADRVVEPGQLVMTLLGAANRDPSVFASPASLDLARHPNPHVAFGRGIHFCLGAPLARLEGQIAIGALVGRFAHLERAGAPRRRPTITLRGFESLPLRVA